MTLSLNAALSKDKRTAEKRPTFEHRHFAVVASIISELHPRLRNEVAFHFAERLGDTNPRFDSKRFLKAAKEGP